MSKHATVTLIGLLLLLCMAPSFAQDGNITVKGTVLDKETQDPLEYATLVLQSIDNPKKITGGITDAEGKFNVSAEPGKYHIRIEYISYTPYIMPD
ncbi:MAG TPA: carboxypeptidase-like regulatory domain-containing protein, partial [Arenibacter sp.]|nr:carboxypeptidase-like regulatory domain-containing protein [Arenibacter sp.]